MNESWKVNLFPILSLLAAVLLLGACSSPDPRPSTIHVPADMKQILVLPFKDVGGSAETGGSVRCPLSGKMFQTGGVEKDAQSVLDDRLRKILQNQPRFRFISPNQTDNFHAVFGGSTETKDMQDRAILVDLGKKNGADGVLVGHIYRYLDRVGGKYSVERPASTAFDVHLVRVFDGRVIWSNSFDETQKALTDDLFKISRFFERDGQWITARQMAEAGLDTLMESFKLQ